MSTTRLFYARAVLNYGTFQRTAEYEQALVAIFTGEDSTAAWNPGDTTMFYPGATPYNDFGPNGEYHVWNYANGLDGVHCTVATLAQANMRTFYDALKTEGKTAIELCQAFSQTPWAYKGDVVPEQIAADWNDHKRDYVVDRQALVHGPGAWSFQFSGLQIPGVK